MTQGEEMHSELVLAQEAADPSAEACGARVETLVPLVTSSRRSRRLE